MDQKLELLKQVPLFARLGSHELEEVGRLATEVDVEAGRPLMTEGESGREFFVVIDGAVAVERAGASLRTLGPGDFLGEIALLDGGPRSATATTTAPSRLLVLGRREFQSLVAEFPPIRNAVLEALAERVRHLAPDDEV